MEPAETQALIVRLREEIRRRESGAALQRPVLASGFGPLDSLLPGGGFPAGRVVELCGAKASGKTTLALLALASATRAGRLVAFIDSSGELYPPAARGLGADLTRMLVVRPRPEQSLRAAALLARSKAFAAVAADLPALKGPLGPMSRRLLEAAETGRAALLLLGEVPSGLDASLRILVERAGPSVPGPGAHAGVRLLVDRNRMGPPGRSAQGLLPAFPPESDGAQARLLELRRP